MSELTAYLQRKKAILLAAREQEAPQPATVGARVKVLGGSGAREIRIGDFRVISDGPPERGGYGLGPGSPELQLGVLGSCLAHVTLIRAAERDIRLDALETEVYIELSPADGESPDDGRAPQPPEHRIYFKLYIDTPESEDTIASLYEAVEQSCPVLRLLTNPQTIRGELFVNGVKQQ